MNDEDYSTLRQKNITERNAFFADFFKDLKKQTSEERNSVRKSEKEDNIENERPAKRRRIVSNELRLFKPKNTNLKFRKKYNTRSRSKILSNNESENSSSEEDISVPKNSKSKLKVLFPWAKPFQRTIDLMKMGVCDVDEDEENIYEENNIHRRRVYNIVKSAYDPNSIPSVDEITDELLENVATKSTLKTYCKTNGTSCHQCRQKTLDTKTICRSGECVGIRGQFCGPCLRGRYGESATEALKDPDWTCPPCRGLCNCSICRTRNGLRPTGILAPVAQEEGYSSVMDYLQSAEDDDT